jgi:hypothetical protein
MAASEASKVKVVSSRSKVAECSITESGTSPLPEIHLWKGDTVTFSIEGSSGILIIPRADEIFTDVTDAYLVRDLTPSDPWTGTVGLDVPGPDPQTYPYAVYCEATRDFVEGASSPKMLLEPPDDDEQHPTV